MVTSYIEMGTCTALNVFLTLYACLLINSPSCLHQKNLSAHQTKFIYFFILSMYLYNVLYTYIHTHRIILLPSIIVYSTKVTSYAYFFLILETLPSRLV